MSDTTTALNTESAMDLGRSIIELLRIPHTRYQKRRDSVQVSWEPAATRLTTKKVQRLLLQHGMEPASQDKLIVNQYNYSGFYVFIGPEYGILVVRSQKPVTASAAPARLSASFEPLRPLNENEDEHLNVEKPRSGDILISYDEESEVSAVLILGLDPEEKRIRVAIDTFQGSDDVRYFDDTDSGYSAAKSYANMLATKKYKALPLRATSLKIEASQPEFDEYDDYDQWLQDAKKHWPKAHHNKQGEPGYKPGYGEANDEEFLVGPDMQSDVVGVWVTDDGFGWLMRSDASVESRSVRGADALFNAAYNELSVSYDPSKPWNSETTLDLLMSHLTNDEDFKRVFRSEKEAEAQAREWLKNPPFKLG